MAGIYRQRHPEHTVFYRVLFHYFERFIGEYEDRFEKEYGYFHPHIHVLITEGGTSPDGAFHHVCFFHDEVIQEIFTHKVFSLLLWKKLIGLSLVQKILRWRHTGFNVHSQVRGQTTSEAERVGKYMIRPVLSLKRLSFDEMEGKVRYQHSRHGSQEESLDYLEFIARVTSHIPDKGQVMVRYYGLYSNAHRGKMRKAGASHPPIIEDDPAYVPSKGWAEMIPVRFTRWIHYFALHVAAG